MVPGGRDLLDRGYSWTGLVATVALATEGTNRNSRLYWAAKCVGADYRAGKCSDACQALADLETTAKGVGLGEREIERTIRSGFNYGSSAA
jgi:hypothetical protein